jgi:peptidoglycan hydrolase-like protein with peptidoglycan-binding domain
MSIRSSVGNRGVNRFEDVMLVQQLLNCQRTPAYSYGPIAVDGLSGPQTIGAITTYQRKVVRLATPDG